MSWRPLVEVLPNMDAPRGVMAAPQAAEPAGGQDAAGDAPAAAAGELVPLPRQAAQEGTYRPSRIGNAQGTAEELAQIEERARKQGYEEGAALGRAEQEALSLRLRGAIEEMADAREQTIKACEADLVRLALAISREVLLADAPLREDFAERMAQAALSSLAGPEPITLRMHPRDVAALAQHKPELVRRANVNVVEDASLELGGVVAEGGRGRLDATIDTRLKQIADKLLHEGDGAGR